MKLIKFFSREYPLLEHELILVSLMKEHSSIADINYSIIVDVSRKGFIDIYVGKEDVENNGKRIALAAKRKGYISKMLDKGIVAAKNLGNLPKNLPSMIGKMDDKLIIKEMHKLRQMLFDFSGFLDLTHYLGKSGVSLNDEQIRKLGKYHDHRKLVYMDYFKFIMAVSEKIARKKEMKSNDLGFLSFDEIIMLLDGKLSAKKADALQDERKQRYILIIKNCKERIITKNFDKELAKLEKIIIKEEFSSELKGMPINKGVVRGEVRHLSTKEDFSKVPAGKIFVTHMTNPDMTPILRKALALVTDDGGILSHAANVAREFGIIALIGTKTATQVFKDGDLVEIDADKGIVRKIK